MGTPSIKIRLRSGAEAVEKGISFENVWLPGDIDWGDFISDAGSAASEEDEAERRGMILDVIRHVFHKDKEESGRAPAGWYPDGKNEDLEIIGKLFNDFDDSMGGFSPFGRLNLKTDYYLFVASQSYEEQIKVPPECRPIMKTICGKNVKPEKVLYICVRKDYSFGIGFTADSFSCLTKNGRYSISYDALRSNNISGTEKLQIGDEIIDCENLSEENIDRNSIAMVLKRIAAIVNDAD